MEGERRPSELCRMGYMSLHVLATSDEPEAAALLIWFLPFCIMGCYGPSNDVSIPPD